MKTSRPRHARKEVRQLAQWLEDNGWVFEDFDANGHTIWRYTTGATITLPETPSGHSWLARTRADAHKAMGHKPPKYKGGKSTDAASMQRMLRRRQREAAAAREWRSLRSQLAEVDEAIRNLRLTLRQQNSLTLRRRLDVLLAQHNDLVRSIWTNASEHP